MNEKMKKAKLRSATTRQQSTKVNIYVVLYNNTKYFVSIHAVI